MPCCVKSNAAVTKITESEIETFAIKLFERLGYQYIYAPSIAPDSDARSANVLKM